jgi:hypothetical protein
MKDVREDLARTIKAEIRIQQRILDRLKEQEEILVKCSFSELEENLKHLDGLRFEARELHIDREALKGDLARWLHLKKDNVPLKELAGAAGGPYAEGLSCLRDKLVESAKAVRAQSRLNMVIIRQSIKLNNELIAGVRGEFVDHLSTYGKGGEIIPSESSGIVDAQI